MIFNQIYKNLYIFVQNHDLKDKILKNRSEIYKKSGWWGDFGAKICGEGFLEKLTFFLFGLNINISMEEYMLSAYDWCFI